MSSNPPNYSSLSTSEEQNVWIDAQSRPQVEQGVDQDVHLATRDEKKRLWWKNSAINVLFMLSWFFFALILSLYNKWMFDKNRYGFPYPLFVTSLHMWMQFILAAFVRFTWPNVFKPPNRPNLPDYCKKAVPTAVSQAIDIGFSNWSLRFITLALYTMVKSSTLIFVLLFAFIFRLEPLSIRTIAVVLFIFVGVLMSVAAETTIQITGLLLVLLGSACAGLRWSLTQVLLKKSPKMGMNNPAATLFWLAPSMGVTLATLSMIIDGWGNVFSLPFFARERLLQTILYLVFPGILAFCMVLSEYYIIQRTGVLPMSIAGIFKEVMTLSASAYIFGDHLNPVNLTGVIITFLGVFVYIYHKYRKSLDSKVALDAHGNPIPEEDEAAVAILKEDEGDEEERSRFVDGGTEGEEGGEHLRGPSRSTDNRGMNAPQHVLFSASENDLLSPTGGDFAASPRPQDHRDRVRELGYITNGSGSGTNAVVRESLEIQRQWGAQSPPPPGR